MSVGDDGARVINLVTWASEQDFRQFEETSDTAGRAAAIEAALTDMSGQAELRMTEAPRYRLAREVRPAGA